MFIVNILSKLDGKLFRNANRRFLRHSLVWSCLLVGCAHVNNGLSGTDKLTVIVTVVAIINRPQSVASSFDRCLVVVIWLVPSRPVRVKITVEDAKSIGASPARRRTVRCCFCDAGRFRSMPDVMF